MLSIADLSIISLSIRRADKDDALHLLRWKNDELARRFSILSRKGPPIALANHLAWLEERLKDPATELNIIEFHGVPAGDIRLDRIGIAGPFQETEISVRLAPEFRGRGIAAKAILLVLKRRPIRVFARILKDNVASMKTFQKCGFLLTEDCGEWWRLEHNG